MFYKILATIQIANRIDYETLAPITHKVLEVKVHAFNDVAERAILDINNSNNNQEKEFETIAMIEVQIFDIDDSSPTIEVIGSNHVQVSENVKPGTIMLEFIGKDLDSKKLKYSLSGTKEALKNFQIQQVRYYKLF